MSEGSEKKRDAAVRKTAAHYINPIRAGRLRKRAHPIVPFGRQLSRQPFEGVVMSRAWTNLDTPRRLSELLEPGHAWPPADGLLLIRRLARRARSLHREGQTHRAIGIDAVTVDAQLPL